MIVAPLMTPILGTVLAVVLADHANLLRSLGLLVLGALAVIAIGWVIGMVVDLPVVADGNSQVSGRVTPRLVDLLAALATGAVGSIALARDDIADTLPGVAIAISLVPPLAVVGLTLESGAGEQALGALLLFLTNVCAILATGLVVMAAYRVSRQATVAPDGIRRQVHRGRAVLLIVAALVVICIPLAATSGRITRTRTAEADIEAAATVWAASAGWEVTSVTTRVSDVLVRVTGSGEGPDPAGLRRALDADGLADVSVEVQLVPSRSVRLDPSA
jgi:uncharacterized hydrophobic protein (TIGR00271 family)